MPSWSLPPLPMDSHLSQSRSDFASCHRLAALLDRGAVLAEAGQWLEALRSFDAASHAVPSSASAHEQRAQVLLEIGRAFDAVQAAETACTLDPAWGSSRRTLARAQLNHGELELAVRSFEAAVPLLLASGDELDARECLDEAAHADGILALRSVRCEMTDAGRAPASMVVGEQPSSRLGGVGQARVLPCGSGEESAVRARVFVQGYDPGDLSQQVFDLK